MTEGMVPQEKRFIDAIKAGDVAQVSEYLEKDPGLTGVKSDEGLSPILVALYYGKPEIARLILDQAPVMDIFDAAAAGDLEQVEALVEERHELANAYNVDGFQPLGLAAFFSRPQVAKFLLEMGADPNSASRNAMSVMPLHSAAASKNIEIAKALLERGADPNAVQADDFRPIHEAAQNGQLEMVQLLLEHGADPALLAAGGKSALDFAQEADNQAIIALLQENR